MEKLATATGRPVEIITISINVYAWTEYKSGRCDYVIVNIPNSQVSILIGHYIVINDSAYFNGTAFEVNRMFLCQHIKD